MRAEEGLQHGDAEVDGVRLHYVEAGEGPLVLLLHGFPEFWYGWHRQIPMLADAGFRVVAPDMRGYNLSDKPRGWRNYERGLLSGDVANLVRALGAERAHVVGHDWGGAVAWCTAMDHPGVVDRLVVLDAGHPVRYVAHLRQPRQLLKSWYVFFFQIPGLPEAAVRAGNWRLFRNAFEKDARPGAFDPEEIERYIEAWSKPGAIKAQIDYYRAAIRGTPFSMRRLREANPPVQAPTMVIWGENDRYGVPEVGRPEPEEAPNLERFVILPGASHWVQHEEPERVGQLLVEFLQG
jgi:pimeloyl-ACP methyl ester carboxylesterase